jgi:DNA repair exonuclease SbcCD ATPase subunit
MDINFLIVVAIALLTIIIVYFVNKAQFRKKLNEQIDSINKNLDRYKSLDEALLKTLTQLSTTEEQLDTKTNELTRLQLETTELKKLQENEQNLYESVNSHTSAISALEAEKEKLKTNIISLISEQKELMGTLDLYSRLEEFRACGHFETPEYLYETSVRFVEEIKDVRQQQKDLIRDKNAVTYPATTIFSNDKSLNRRILDSQVKLMLTAFNTECDFLIGKVSPSSFGRTLERIEKLANTLEKSSATLECGFNIEYVELKFEECKLQYQYCNGQLNLERF